ncbi:hypothetical protein [Thiomicrorhabdus cannonii]|uniref:hypothetical protein n=1 Tax=Thiomicrorhabdus cannonii TaxID=2748011 RepID=UPI0015C1421D|nr:hypothetical protein [Thiomicrorhabdus cannonii]
MRFYIDQFGKPYILQDNQSHLALPHWEEITYERWELVYKKGKPNNSTASKTAEAIIDRLNQIDHESIRPLRAVVLNRASEEDYQKLEALDNERTNLVEELGRLL